MVVRIVSILLVSVMLVFLADVRPAVCEGWSLPNPFSSEKKPEPRPKKPTARAAKQDTSTLGKLGTGTKNFFSKTGETLGLKKPDAKRPQYASPKPPVIQTQRKEESKSWLGSLFKPEEPKKPKDVKEWLANKRLDP